MEIRIGLKESARELTIDTEAAPDELEQLVEAAFSADEPFVRFVNERGRVFLVRTAEIQFVELGAEEQRRVGFIA
ncbi:MAG: DUF3107 domain-containing protein [Pseudoclavibacter sp.]|nr:DUF3107 domain-containing protein [Pseudoclavibacter sp.]